MQFNKYKKIAQVGFYTCFKHLKRRKLYCLYLIYHLTHSHLKARFYSFSYQYFLLHLSLDTLI